MPSISDLLDSDMEGNFIDENSIISSASDMTDAPTTATNGAAKKTKKRHRVTMPKAKSKMTKVVPGPAMEKSSNARKKRMIMEDDAIPESQYNTDNDAEGMEVEDTDAHTRKSIKKQARKTKPVTEQNDEDGMEIEQTPAVARSSHAQNTTTRNQPKVVKATKVAPKKRVLKETILETPIDTVHAAAETHEADEIAAQQPPMKRARTESRTRQEGTFRRRAGSASDTERGDPNLRRKLGDITRKFENIDTKYKALKEVGITEANANVEKLRRQCEATTEASNNLIASLKKELAQQSSLAQEARKLKKELHAREDEMVQLRASQQEITASLGNAQNEIKALHAKLAAARTAPISVEQQPTKTPGSAIKVARPVVVSNAEANQAIQTAQMKLDLYGDLTGLIVRSVKRAADGDTFDCIQTGRNGTLHFKLFIDQEDAKSASFEETEFLYTPLLDNDRDHDMMELMPPYLTEDITFARQNAAKFYQRVVDTLTRRTNE